MISTVTSPSAATAAALRLALGCCCCCLLLCSRAAALRAAAGSAAPRRGAPPMLVCSSSTLVEPQRHVPSPARCSELEAVRARAFQAPAVFSEFWGRQTCWPLSSKTVARAAHPNGHAGARRRWQRVAEKLLEGSEPVSVVVFGGSMTQGTQANGPWSERLQSLFNETGWPRVTVTNLAVAGSTSETVIPVLANNEKLVREADIFIVDYAVNDDVGSGPDSGGPGSQAWEARKQRFSEVLALLISFPQHPAVLNIETISRPGVDKALCEPRVEMEGTHWDAVQAHGVPTISYSKAVCDCKRSFWMHRDSDADADTSNPDPNDWHHPGPITHELVAQLIFASFTLEMEGVCKKGITGLDHVAAQATVSEQTQCLSNPRTQYSATSSPEEEDFRPGANLGGVWEFREDVPGKPGWIASAGSSHPGELVFNVDISLGGWLRLDYLASYEGVGNATVWLDAASPSAGNGCTLQGKWSSHSSQSRPSLMRLSFADAGRHELHVRSEPGSKFKLLGVMSC